MAGHSKWANIKRKKAKMDAQRANVISKAVREVMLAAKQGGGNPEANIRLRIAIERARSFNVSMENIERAIKRGTGELEGTQVEEITYEGYGPGGTALLVETATDNRNRTAAEIRHLLSKHGGKMAELGAVSWMFDHRGLIILDKQGLSEEQALEMCIDAGALDMRVEDDCYEVYTEPGELEEVRAKLEKAGARIQSAELTRVPKTYVSLDKEDAIKMLALMDVLESHDDVSRVYANFDIPDDILDANA